MNNKVMEYCYTKLVAHITECTYTGDTFTTQLTIDEWNTIT